MANDVAIISQEELDAFAKRAGAEQSNGDFLPQLKVNYEDEDSDGKELKKGDFFITGQDLTVYAKSVSFRPLTHHFQWIKFDDVAKKVTNRTRFVPSFREEPRDEQGTLRCGKPPSKDLKANPALAKKYEDITCYRTVQGLATYTGKTADGKTAEVKDVPCALRLKGSNFSPFEEEYFGKLGKDKLWDHDLQLTVSKEKNGASTYYVIHYEADFASRVPMTVEVFKTANVLQDRVDSTNKEIDTKYYDAVHKRTQDEKSAELVDELSDDIPF